MVGKQRRGKGSPTVRIREYRMSDYERLCELFLDEEVLWQLGEGASLKTRTRKGEKVWLLGTIRKYRKAKPSSLSWVIEADGEFVGGIGIQNIDLANRKTEMGYWLGRPYWGRGIMTAALKQFLRLIDRKYGFVRVYGMVFSDNMASQRVMEKAGFRLEGVLRKNMVRGGKSCDERIYAKVR